MRYFKGWTILDEACMRTTRWEMSEGLWGKTHWLSANVFQICSVLEIPQFHLAGRCGPRGWMSIARVGDHLETFCLPQATLRSQQESWRAVCFPTHT